MKILELFSGTESFSKVARARGHQCFTIDNEPKFKPNLCIDINKITLEDLRAKLPWNPDFIWASPPCQKFSVASIYRHWEKGKPKHNGTYEAMLLVAKTISLIMVLKPKYWIIENPRGMLRKQDFMINLSKVTVTYCKYGFEYQKATDFWNNIYHWRPRPMCSPGDPCHVRAPRGSNAGTQGVSGYRKNRNQKHPVDSSMIKAGRSLQHPDWNYTVSRASEVRAMIPEELCKEILEVCEDRI